MDQSRYVDDFKKYTQSLADSYFKTATESNLTEKPLGKIENFEDSVTEFNDNLAKRSDNIISAIEDAGIDKNALKNSFAEVIRNEAVRFEKET